MMLRRRCNVVRGDFAVSLGAAYETWVFAELLKWKQLQPLGPELYFYRTAAGLEVDFLLVDELVETAVLADVSEFVEGGFVVSGSLTSR